MNKEHKKESLQNDQVHDNGYDHLNMHHHPGNAKQIEEQSLPGRLTDAQKTHSIKPGETLHKKVKEANHTHGDDVC